MTGGEPLFNPLSSQEVANVQFPFARLFNFRGKNFNLFHERSSQNFDFLGEMIFLNINRKPKFP